MRRNDGSALREKLELYPTEELDHMLQTELQKEDSNSDVVIAILAVLQEREKDMPIELTYADRLAWQKYLSHTHTQRKPVKKRNWMLRAACIVAILGIFVGMVSYDVGADAILGRIARWTDSVIEFFSPESTDHRQPEFTFKTNHPGLQQVYDVVTNLGVTKPVVPMWIPEGYTLTYCNEIRTENKTTVMAGFKNDPKVICYNLAIRLENVPTKYQKEEAGVVSYDFEDTTHYIIRNYDMWVVIWTQENIECSVSVDCREDELYKIIQSIYDEEVTS